MRYLWPPRYYQSLLTPEGTVVKVGDTFESYFGPPTFTYVPGAAIDGPRTVTFKFSVTDAGDGSSPPLTSTEATVTINVTKAVADGVATV